MIARIGNFVGASDRPGHDEVRGGVGDAVVLISCTGAISAAEHFVPGHARLADGESESQVTSLGANDDA